jgi:hypothetical protein
MSVLRPYVDGRRPLYAVVERRGCFALTLLTPAYPTPPYGISADFCFDARTGAPAGSTVRRAGAVDVTVVERAHAPATEADFVVPSDAQVASGALVPS